MFVPIVILYICFCLLQDPSVKAQCVEPPMECPNENITFWVFTRQNEKEGHQVWFNDSESIKSAPWVPNAPIKILIHGYTGYRDFSPNTEIRPAYMQCCDYNIISIDYNPIAREPCYVEAARNTELVGKCTAQLICELVDKHNFSLEQFHVIGFSLGGQIAGFTGNYMTCGRLSRISALDPALPLFVTQDNNKKIDKSDANFVDALHTNSLEKGKLESCGDVDFYANGGINQPGCEDSTNETRSSCNHARAPIYYAESITTSVGFYAKKCHSWLTYTLKLCMLFGSREEIIFGEYVPIEATGNYFFNTNSKSPYAQGPSKKKEPPVQD